MPHRFSDPIWQLLPRSPYAHRQVQQFPWNQNPDLLTGAYAPEHLIISTENANELAEKVINAGSVFVGEYTPESAGDYASGTNHTLPTNGSAVAYSGVNLDSYYKKITFQNISKEGLKKLGPTIEKMAMTEDLTAHQRAVALRLRDTL